MLCAPTTRGEERFQNVGQLWPRRSNEPHGAGSGPVENPPPFSSSGTTREKTKRGQISTTYLLRTYDVLYIHTSTSTVLLLPLHCVCKREMRHCIVRSVPGVDQHSPMERFVDTRRPWRAPRGGWSWPSKCEMLTCSLFASQTAASHLRQGLGGNVKIESCHISPYGSRARIDWQRLSFSLHQRHDTSVSMMGNECNGDIESRCIGGGSAPGTANEDEAVPHCTAQPPRWVVLTDICRSHHNLPESVYPCPCLLQSLSILSSCVVAPCQ